MENHSDKRPDSSHIYAPTYQYHQKKHQILRAKYKKGGSLYSGVAHGNDIKTKPPLKGLLDKSASVSSLNASSWASDWSGGVTPGGSTSSTTIQAIQQNVEESLKKRDFQGVVMNSRPMGTLGSVDSLGGILYNDGKLTKHGTNGPGSGNGSRLGWTPGSGIHTLSPQSRHALQSDRDMSVKDEIDALHSITSTDYASRAQQERERIMLSEALDRMDRIQQKSQTTSTTAYSTLNIADIANMDTTNEMRAISASSFGDSLDSREGNERTNSKGDAAIGDARRHEESMMTLSPLSGAVGEVISNYIPPPQQDHGIFSNTQSNDGDNNNYYNNNGGDGDDDDRSVDGDLSIHTTISHDNSILTNESRGVTSSILLSDALDVHVRNGNVGQQVNDDNNDDDNVSYKSGDRKYSDDSTANPSNASWPLLAPEVADRDSREKQIEGERAGTLASTSSEQEDDCSQLSQPSVSLLSVSNFSQLDSYRDRQVIENGGRMVQQLSTSAVSSVTGHDSHDSRLSNMSQMSSHSRVETLAAEILTQRSSMISVQSHKRGAMRRTQVVPIRSHRSSLMVDDGGRDDDNHSILSTSTLNTLGSKMGGSILPGRITPGKNQTYEDAFMESLYLGGGKNKGAMGGKQASASRGGGGERWKMGGKSLKYEYVPSITCKVYDRDR